jgi:hypothetical protein
MLMRPGLPALMLLVQALPVGFAHNPSVSREAPGYKTWPTHYDPCPRDVPELPSIANDCHQQPPANMKLRQALDPRATHRDTLVMRRSSVRFR